MKASALIVLLALGVCNAQTFPRPVVDAAIRSVKTIVTDAMIYAKQDFEKAVSRRLDQLTSAYIQDTSKLNVKNEDKSLSQTIKTALGWDEKGQATLPRPAVDKGLNAVKTMVTDALIYAKQDFQQSIKNQINAVQNINVQDLEKAQDKGLVHIVKTALGWDEKGQATLPRPIVDQGMKTVKTIVTDALIYARQDFEKSVSDRINTIKNMNMQELANDKLHSLSISSVIKANKYDFGNMADDIFLVNKRDVSLQ